MVVVQQECVDLLACVFGWWDQDGRVFDDIRDYWWFTDTVAYAPPDTIQHVHYCARVYVYTDGVKRIYTLCTGLFGQIVSVQGIREHDGV